MDEDYIQDGLLYCGKCHTPKERYLCGITGAEKLFSFAPGAKVRCLCKCAAAERAAEEEAWRKRRMADEADRLKTLCFGSSILKRRTLGLFADDGHLLNVAEAFLQGDWSTGSSAQCKTGLYLCGDNGTGKTCFAAALANAAMDQGRSCRFYTMADILNAPATERGAMLRQASECALFVLDDFGAERGNPYGTELAFTVLDTRCKSGRKTVITSNIPWADIQNPPDKERKRVYGRIKEMCIPVGFSGGDRRDEVHRSHVEEFKKRLRCS